MQMFTRVFASLAGVERICGWATVPDAHGTAIADVDGEGLGDAAVTHGWGK